MLSFLKKIFNNKPAKITSDDNDLISKLTEVINYDNLNQLVYSSVNKLYLVNTYSTDFNDLLTNMYNKNYNRNIIAINIHSYFNNSRIDIAGDFSRIIKCLKDYPTNKLVEHDLFELVELFNHLKELENKNGWQ